MHGISAWPDTGRFLTISRCVDTCAPILRRMHGLLSALCTAVAQEPCVTLDLSDGLDILAGQAAMLLALTAKL